MCFEARDDLFRHANDTKVNQKTAMCLGLHTQQTVISQKVWQEVSSAPFCSFFAFVGRVQLHNLVHPVACTATHRSKLEIY